LPILKIKPYTITYDYCIIYLNWKLKVMKPTIRAGKLPAPMADIPVTYKCPKKALLSIVDTCARLLHNNSLRK
jgi:hypothetical protein